MVHIVVVLRAVDELSRNDALKKFKEMGGEVYVKESEDARASFFRRALETAHGLGVVDCRDCKIETE